MNRKAILIVSVILLAGTAFYPPFFSSLKKVINNFLPEHSSPGEYKFLVTADPQYKYDELNPDQISAIHSDYIASKMETKIKAGGYKGLIIAGDLTHYARPDEMHRYLQSINGFKEYVFDGIGNHDFEFPENEGTNIEGVQRFGLSDLLPEQKRGWHPNSFDVWEEVRSRKRVTPINSSYPNLHYSWDWGDIHFVHLNLFPGDEPKDKWALQNPLRSLTFLKEDLERHVGNSGRPVILIHHYGFDDFSMGIDEEGTFHPNGQWWTIEQRKKYWEAIKAYNVAVIFSGHAHHCRPVCYLPWDGENIGEDNVEENYIPSFIAGAAREGYFLDCTVTWDAINVKRYLREDLLLEKTIPLKRPWSD